ncbi:MAG: MFS transporter [Candidatus Bathyarchaeota archaeon]|nr:MAG: MFS transporter [Candidatus Bathyarchaeota archaeon]
MLGWLSRDGKTLLTVRPLQSFSASFVSIFIAVYLNLIGVPLWQIGVVLTAGLLASTIFNTAAGFLADRMGRRRMLIFFGLLTVFSGVVFATLTNPIILVLVAVVSSLGYRGGLGPAQTLERVILAQSCPDERRTRMYAIRSTLNSAAVSAGSLFAGLVVVLQSRFGLAPGASYRWMFWIYALLNGVAVVLYLLLSEAAEVEQARVEALPLSPETRKNVTKLSLLFSVDSLGGGFVTHSLVSYWFFDRFGLDMDAIGLIFASSSFLAALSFMLAAWISERIGLINTMVYSHLPANLMTMSIPWMPNLSASSSIYVGRSLLAQMDVPTRQSYVMAIVEPEERSRVAGIINLPRSLTSALGPSIAGFMMQFLGSSLPFLFAGGLKAAYDLALYFMFRNVKPPEESVNGS